jgi:hypothetical protein
MSPGQGEAAEQPWGDLSDDAFFAHAALVIQDRREYLSVTDVVEYLYGVADDIGVDGVELARVIVKFSDGRHSHPG